MPRLLLCIFAALAIGATVLLLRQQRLRLNYEQATLHRQILDVERRLWSQQLQVAAATAPAALEQTLAAHAARGELVTTLVAPNDAWAELELPVYSDGDWSTLETP
jgi:hypothetical protein